MLVFANELEVEDAMDIRVDILIACPVEDVFAVVSRYEYDPRWRSGIVEMVQEPPGCPRPGTTTREVGRFFGRKMVTPAEVTQYEAGRYIAFAGLMDEKIKVSGSRMVLAAGEQSRFIYQAKVEISGLYLLLEPLLVMLLRQRFTSDLQRLKRLLEDGTFA